LLECAWEALENAGYDAERYEGAIGVYAGKSMSSYLFLNVYPHIKKILAAGNLQAAIGNDKDSITSTISYRLNLKGPSINVQSSSSTSLAAVAIVAKVCLPTNAIWRWSGGITVGPPVKSGYLYDVGGIMSSDGHCRALMLKAVGLYPVMGMDLWY
jgi:acyl transferase domain-containing protein